LIQTYETVTRAIRGVASEHISSYFHEGQQADASIRANLDAFRKEINVDAALQLIDEIAACKGKINDLAERKLSLGLK
jgi:hypothetical protein